ncbi:GNAT family N-acetyltransferase [Joostella atrarenae]|uniref:GNAT family N-acetyltransferase n=1 Tax=Joostella atrarenae TaxID=679257 RepID=A0ABS9J426_9FLAO|nr:GNAT family N-acetyltransferase [Joostella atrarenae]MCF8715191.1 GNAT family N-acetyltransferase [Joostella atrarenae]
MFKTSIALLNEDAIEKIVTLTQQLNPTKSKESLLEMHRSMFTFNGYKCFGLFYEEELVGICSGWITVKLYSGKQLELDNVIINSDHQSKGFGKILISKIGEWAAENDFETMELNTYVGNGRSHKFYFNQGFEIIGYHFQKKI